MIDCENYIEGMCFYLNGNNIAIYEKCHMKSISNDYRNEYVKNCLQRKTIKTLKRIQDNSERLLEQKV